MSALADSPENRGPLVNAACIFLLVIVTIAIVFRFLSRKLSNAGFWWDDWVILAALPLVLANLSLTLIAVGDGFGRHLDSLPDPTQAVVKYRHHAYYSQILYACALPLVKISILLFYGRLFPTRTVKIMLWTLGIVVILCLLAFALGFAFQCYPVQKAWDTSIPGTCFNINASFLLWNSISNSITDIAVVVLPLPLVWKLQLAKSQRIALVGLFLTGAFVCGVSVGRLGIIVAGVSDKDVTWNHVNIHLLSITESAVGLVCACLPFVRALLTVLISKIYAVTSPGGPSNLSGRHECINMDSRDVNDKMSSTLLAKERVNEVTGMV